MREIQLICMGKLNADYYAAGVADYAKRLEGFCDFRIVELPEAPLRDKNASRAEIERALAAEGENILRHVKKGASLVTLCVEGKALSSSQLSEFIERCAMQGTGDIAFVIGSSHGLAPAVKQAAALRLSMGAMTFPHQLARLMLAEQIYRAFTILRGMKYHK